MSKSILVIDTPRNCEDCRLMGRNCNGKYCSPGRYFRPGELTSDFNVIGKPDWCPLRDIKGVKGNETDADKIILALEKQVPYKITYQNGSGYCKCGCEFEREGYEGEEYCPECGQKVWVGGYNGEKNKIVSFAEVDHD